MLTHKQKKFIACYQGNATAAAKKAGYSEKSAELIGHQLLKKTKVAEAIKKRQEKENRPDIADRQERESFLTGVVRDGEEEMRNRIDACDKLNKMNGDYITKHEVSGPDGGPIKTEDAGNDLRNYSKDEIRKILENMPEQ